MTLPPNFARSSWSVSIETSAFFRADVASAENVAADGFDSEARRPPGGPAPDWSRAGGSGSSSESHFQSMGASSAFRSESDRRTTCWTGPAGGPSGPT